MKTAWNKGKTYKTTKLCSYTEELEVVAYLKDKQNKSKWIREATRGKMNKEKKLSTT